LLSCAFFLLLINRAEYRYFNRKQTCLLALLDWMFETAEEEEEEEKKTIVGLYS